MRAALDLEDECCCDCLVWTLFPFCATCEESRELKFRHVGTTEEFLDKSQEIRVQQWQSGLEVNFKAGERVIHPYRGAGNVMVIMPDGRRAVKYDDGPIHLYSPGKVQWKFRLAQDQKKCCQFCHFLYPVLRSYHVDEHLMAGRTTGFGAKLLKVGDRVVQNDRGTGTVIEACGEQNRMVVRYDEKGDHDSEIVVVHPGNDPQMNRLRYFGVVPCCLLCVPEPTTIGAVDGHAADDADETAHYAHQLQFEAFYEDEDENDVGPDSPSSRWFAMSAPKEEQKVKKKKKKKVSAATKEMQKDLDSAIKHENFEEAARLKKELTVMEVTSDVYDDPHSEVAGLKLLLSDAVANEDFEQAAILKTRVREAEERVADADKTVVANFDIAHLGADEAAKDAFLDKILQDSLVGADSGKKKKKKKRRKRKEDDISVANDEADEEAPEGSVKDEFINTDPARSEGGRK